MVTKMLRAVLAFCLLATLAFSADTVELLPGKITGAVSLSSGTIEYGSVSASASDGSGSATSSLSGSSFSITVPAGKTWRLNFNLTLRDGTQFTVYTADNVTVGANATVTQNYHITTARITADVQVANGSLNSFGYLQAYGSDGTVNFSSYVSGAGSITVLPMNGVSVYGTASLRSSEGQNSTVALASQSVNVPAAGATATWSVNAAFVSSTIQGAFQYNGGPALSWAQIYSYGPNSTYNGLNLSSYGNFQFDNLQAGNYTVYAYAGFPSSQIYQYRQLELAAGAVATVNFTGDLATAKVPFNLTGFATTAPNLSATLYGVGPNETTGYSNLDSGSFTQVVTTGSWSFSQINLNSWSPEGYFSIYNYNSQVPSTTFAAGDTLTVPAVTLNTTETEFTFDVVEAAGATSETLISSPRINGWVYRYSPSGQYLGYSSIYVQSYATAVAKPRVRVVGEPGSYTLQAFAQVDGSEVSFGTFTVELKAPLPTPVGTNVTVNPGPGVGLTFDNVTTAGVTTVSQLPVGPTLPAGYSNLTSQGAKVYYSASTTATFSGYIDVSISFDPSSVPAALEAGLRLFYYDKATETWIDITTSVDEVNNIITGTAPGLSTFAIGLAHAPTIDSLQVPSSITAGSPATFTATFSDADFGDRHTAQWTFGSSSVAGVVDQATGTVTVTTVFATGGKIAGKLTLRDSTDNVVERNFAFFVEGGAPRDTVAPIITLPNNLTVEATSAAGATASFEVSATDDQDGAVAVTLSAASGSTFPLGTTQVTATARDRAGNTTTTSFTVTVVDTIAPVISAPANMVLEATSSAGASASFAASATDATGATLSYSLASGSTFAIGTTTVTVTATDAVGNRSTATFTVTVRDTTAPVFSRLSTNVTSLWPANHKMVSVTVSATASDAVGSVSYRILSVTSSEPDNGLGDGDTPNDIKITGAMTVDLRAERSGKGNGRTYTITVEAKDAAGNASTQTVTVAVPKSQGGA